MLEIGVLLFLLVSGGGTFLIHSTDFGLCLEDSADRVLLRNCNLDSEAQHWIWINQDMLMCAATFRCLSSQQDKAVQTQKCHGEDVDTEALTWDCNSNRLISRSMFLSTDGHQATLTRKELHVGWRSLNVGDICNAKLRSRRSSEDLEEGAELDEGVDGLTEEQKQYLRWFYRTEDPTTWKYVLLGVAFVCLLIGFLLLGMGTMANKSRKKIAQYKASFVKTGVNEELGDVSPLRDNGTSLMFDRQPQGQGSAITEGDVGERRAGDIVVTWKDGNTSCLYSESVMEEKVEERPAELNSEQGSDDGLKAAE